MTLPMVTLAFFFLHAPLPLCVKPALGSVHSPSFLWLSPQFPMDISPSLSLANLILSWCLLLRLPGLRQHPTLTDNSPFQPWGQHSFFKPWQNFFPCGRLKCYQCGWVLCFVVLFCICWYACIWYLLVLLPDTFLFFFLLLDEAW